MTEAEIIKRAAAGCEASFNQLYLKYNQRLRYQANKLNFDASEDILSEAWLKIWKNLHTFRQESSFYSWAYRIVTFTGYNYNNSRKRKPAVLECDTSESFTIETTHIDTPENELIAEESLSHIEDSMGNEFASLVVEYGLSAGGYEGLAKKYNVPEGTIKSRIHRGREFMDNHQPAPKTFPELKRTIPEEKMDHIDWEDPRVKLVVEQQITGRSCKALSQKYKVPIGTIKSRLHKGRELMQEPKKSPPRYIHYGNNLRAKLDTDKVRFIKSNPDIPPAELASQFGVDRTTIFDIRQGRTWVGV